MSCESLFFASAMVLVFIAYHANMAIILAILGVF